MSRETPKWAIGYWRASQFTPNWTTNYDKLIEKSLEDEKKVPDVKYTVQHLAVTRPERDVVVYKMHGDVDHSDKAVICKDDYEKYPFVMGQFASLLRGDLIEKTFLFVLWLH